MNREIIITGDGSPTIFVPELKEHYHSVYGAVQESKHVFIEAGLNSISKNNIRIFEVGYGTGLNAFLTMQESLKKDLSIVYYAIELYPLEPEITDQLKFNDFLRLSSAETNLYNNMHKAAWDLEIQITPGFTLKKIKHDILSSEIDFRYDLVYFDAFAPDVQPELWDKSIFQKIYNQLNKDGILVTYCVKGQVRRTLKETGFKVEKLPGPPGKREMIRAVKSTEQEG
jgi:tRNA U34 5-methylaminomethyl-2-thiouridine-forming methyltransferase MnmC